MLASPAPTAALPPVERGADVLQSFLSDAARTRLAEEAVSLATP
jgi:hypothetical protein